MSETAITLNGGHYTGIKEIVDTKKGIDLSEHLVESSTGNEIEALVPNDVLLSIVSDPNYTDLEKSTIISILKEQFRTPYSTASSARESINIPNYPEAAIERSKKRLEAAEILIAKNKDSFTNLIDRLPKNLGPKTTEQVSDLRNLLHTLSPKRS